MKKTFSIHKIAQLSLFAALALAIYGIESVLPVPIPIPGAKLGLANIITLVVLQRYGGKEAALVLLVRLLLGCLLFGQFISLLYSLAGGFLCLLVEFLLNKFLYGKHIYISALSGAIAHNMGQLCIALLLTSVPGVIVYAPYLILLGAVTGLFTGLCAHFTLRVLPYHCQE